MEGFDYHIEETRNDEIDEISPLSLISASEYSNSEVDNVFFPEQSGMLPSMESTSRCQEVTYLAPMSDIYSEMELNASLSGVQETTHLSSTWTLNIAGVEGNDQYDTYSTNLPKSGDDVTCDLENSFYSMAHNSGMLPDPQMDFNNSTCTLLGSELTAINQIFQNFEEPQKSPPLTLLNLPAANMNPEMIVDDNSLAQLHELHPEMAADISTSVMSNFEDRQIIYCPLTSTQQDVMIENQELSGIQCENMIPVAETMPGAQTFPIAQQMYENIFLTNEGHQDIVPRRTATERKDGKPKRVEKPQQVAAKGTKGASSALPINISKAQQKLLLTIKPQSDVQQNFAQKLLSVGEASINTLPWAGGAPSSQMSGTPDVVVLPPLRTRKLVTSKKTASVNVTNAIKITTPPLVPKCKIDNPITITKDTTAPLLTSVVPPKHKAPDRRKQKHLIIPGSENLEFEVQPTTTDVEENDLSTKEDDRNNSWPSVDASELDEIFKRKKKGTKEITKSNSQVNSPSSKGPPPKKACSIRPAPQRNIVPESSASYTEKVADLIGMRRVRKDLPAFVTDSEDSEDDNNNILPMNGRNPLKCQKCDKLYKTARSLNIHIKRCTVQTEHLNVEKSNGVQEKALASRSECKSISEANSKWNRKNPTEISKVMGGDFKGKDTKNNRKSRKSCKDSGDEKKPRPTTRSQSRRLRSMPPNVRYSK